MLKSSMGYRDLFWRAMGYLCIMNVYARLTRGIIKIKRKKKRGLLQKPKRQIDKRQRNQIVAVVAISSVLIFLFFNIGKGVYESAQVYNANKAIRGQIEALYKEKQELLIKKSQIDNPEVLEHETKKALKLLKPGEKVIVLKEQ